MHKILILALALSCNNTRAQTAAIILKDSLLIEDTYYVLEEVQLKEEEDTASIDIYRKIRNTYGILNNLIPASPKERLQAKKDTLAALVADNALKEAGYGFEHYELLYDRKGIWNLSVAIQSYGSPFEAKRYFCFDLVSGKEIGKSLFMHQSRLTKEVAARLAPQEKNITITTEDLSEFEIIGGHNGTLKGVQFSVTDRQHYRNSGYEMVEVYFSRAEIMPYLAPEYQKRLLIP